MFISVIIIHHVGCCGYVSPLGPGQARRLKSCQRRLDTFSFENQLVALPFVDFAWEKIVTLPRDGLVVHTCILKDHPLIDGLEGRLQFFKNSATGHLERVVCKNSARTASS